MTRAAFALLVIGAASPAIAQKCRIPDRLSLAVPERVEPADVRPMRVTDYTLAISWSPQFCRMSRDPLQCGRDVNFGFVLHGLWPEGEGRAWPQYCRPVGAVPPQVVRETFCTTPSVSLQQHEWQKHGSCMTQTPAQYFNSARILFGAIRYPDMALLSRERPDVARFSAAFAAANRGMTPDMLRVKLSEGGWLEEVRVCLDRRFRTAPCPSDAPGARSRQRMKIWIRR